MFWVWAVIGGIVQLLCCIYGKNRLQRILPIGLWAVVMAATLIFGSMFGSMGFVGALLVVWGEAKVLLVMAAAYGLYALVRFTKK